MGIFKKVGETFKSGLSDGFKEGMGIRHPSDTEYTRISELNNDSSNTDEAVWLEFKLYCKKHDPKIENSNTIAIMERILELRPKLKDELLRDFNKPKQE